MTRCRPIPETVDAWRFDGTTTYGGPLRLNGMPWAAVGEVTYLGGILFVGTPSGAGPQRAKEGDWVIRDRRGDLSVMEHEAFMAAYEPEPENDFDFVRVLDLGPHPAVFLARLDEEMREKVAAAIDRGPGPILRNIPRDEPYVDPRAREPERIVEEAMAGMRASLRESGSAKMIYHGQADVEDDGFITIHPQQRDAE